MSTNKTNNNWYPGHMAKTKRQIMEDLKLIDIIVEVLDARIPVSSKNPDVDEYAENKKRIVALNKSDLADDKKTGEWVEYYKSIGIKAIPVESKSGKGFNNIISAIKNEYQNISNKFSDKGRIGKTIKVMVCGIPNVGKSTFINRLSKKSTAKVENRPGVTRQKQWIKIDDNIDLMDTPGMLWPKLNDEITFRNLAFVNSIGDVAVDKNEISYFLLKLLVENYPDRVEERYNIEITQKESYAYSDILDIQNMIAQKRGALLSGGRINEQKLADIILLDFQSGKLGKITIEDAK